MENTTRANDSRNNGCVSGASCNGATGPAATSTTEGPTTLPARKPAKYAKKSALYEGPDSVIHEEDDKHVAKQRDINVSDQDSSLLEQRVGDGDPEHDGNNNSKARLCPRAMEAPSAWFVALNGAIVFAIVATESSSFGVYYLAYTEYFNTTKAAVGWIKAIQTMVTCLFGLVSSALVSTFGCRRVGLASGVFLCLGFLLSSVAPSMSMLYVTHGVIFGVGVNLATLSSNVIIQQHFHRNRVIGAGLGMMGLTVGQLSGPIVAYHLIELFGLRGALLIHSGVCLNTVVAAANFRPPPQPKPDPQPHDVHQQHPLPDPQHKLEGDTPPIATRSQRLRALLRDIIDFTLFKDAAFVIFSCAGLLNVMNIITLLTHVPGRAVHYGIDAARASYLISIFSIANMVFRTMTIFVANLRKVNTIGYYAAGTIIHGAASILFGFSTEYYGMVVTAILSGMGIGCSLTILPVILVKIVSVERLARGLSLYQLITLLGNSVATPLTGWIYDTTGNYNLPFFITGAAAVIAGAMIFVVARLECRKQQAQTADTRRQRMRTEAAKRARRMRDRERKESAAYYSSIDIR